MSYRVWFGLAEANAERDVMNLRRFLRCENSATAIEYSLIAALIGLAILAALNSSGQF